MKKIFIFITLCLLFFYSTANASIDADHLVISQVQTDSIDGVGGAEDDWIEIHNPTSSPADLTGWSIQKTIPTGSISRKELTGTIPAAGYFLIVRNHANTKVELKSAADVLTASSFSLTDDNTIYLVSNNENITGADDADIIDMVGFGAATAYENTAAVAIPAASSILRVAETNNNSADFVLESNPVARNTATISGTTPPVDPTPPAEPDPTPPASPNPSSGGGTSVPVYSNAVQISEIFPNPDGKDDGEEWIEFYNNSDQIIDLSNWIVDDEGLAGTIGKDAYVFPNGSTINAKSFLAVNLSADNFALNNTGGDSVRLFWPDKRLTASKDYATSAKADESYAWQSADVYTWTNAVTKNGINQFVTVTEPAQDEDVQLVVEKTELPQIVISELFPEPQRGSDQEEFIELYNAGATEIDLTGFTIADASTSHKLTGKIPVGGYLVIKKSESNISFNNSGNESVTLTDEKGQVVATLAYGDAPVNESYNLMPGGKYVWSSTLTPGKLNVISRAKISSKAAATTRTSVPKVALAAVEPAAVQTDDAGASVAAARGQIAGTSVDYNSPSNQSHPLWPWLVGSFAVNLLFCYSLVKLMIGKGNV